MRNWRASSASFPLPWQAGERPWLELPASPRGFPLGAAAGIKEAMRRQRRAPCLLLSLLLLFLSLTNVPGVRRLRGGFGDGDGGYRYAEEVRRIWGGDNYTISGTDDADAAAARTDGDTVVASPPPPPTPNPSLPPLREHTDIAVCVMVKEDNDKILEWIAYHYLALPMKNLIACEEPSNREFIRERLEGTPWSTLIDIEYVLAGYSFFNTQADKEYLKSDDYLHKGGYVGVQNRYYKHCMRRFAEKGKNWTAFIDTDEFMVVDKECNTAECEELRNKTRPINDTLEEEEEDSKKQLMVHSGSILDQLKLHTFQNQSCVLLPRVFFNDIMSVPKLHNVPSIPIANSTNRTALIDPYNFFTLKHRTHLKRVGPHPAKAMLDVSRHREEDISVHGPHAGISPACRRDGYMHGWVDRSMIKIHHYLGTYADYMFRDDGHRSEEKFKEKARKFGSGNPKVTSNDDDIGGWVEELFRQEGGEVAKEALKGVGEHTMKGGDGGG